MERYELDPGTDTLTYGTRRSGWSIVTPSAQTDEERALRNIDAGELQACDRTFGPLSRAARGLAADDRWR